MLQKGKTFQPSHVANYQYLLYYESMFTLQTSKIKTRRSRGIHISNKRNELITKCRHVDKFLLKIYKSRRSRRGRGKGRGR